MNPVSRLPRAFRIAGLVGAVFLTSCAGPRLAILDKPVASTKTMWALTRSDALAKETKLTLRSEDLLALYANDPAEAIRVLAKRHEAHPNDERRQALAEMCSDRADRLTAERPHEAIGHYLDAARLTGGAALAAMGKNGESPDRTLYDYAAVRVTRLLRDEQYDGRVPIVARGALQTYRFRLATGGNAENPASFDTVVPATWLKPKGINWNPIHQDGFGAAMVGHRKNTPERETADPMMPPSGHGYPLNASLRFSAGGEATLVLQDLMRSSEATIYGQTVPLAADFTAPLTFLYYERQSKINKIAATLNPGKYRETIGLYSIEPFREDKTPLILVHGLMSTAEGWLPFLNDLRADPMVREEFQIIAFNYPTGTSIARNAADLRKALAKFRNDYDRDRSNPRMRDMVVVGHSMGGILSNIQIRDSGDELYDLIFTRPIEELNLDSKTKAELQELILFDANPDIDRAVLVAAPHRGSAIASNRIGQLSASLIRLPFDIVQRMVSEIQMDDAVTEEARPAMLRRSSSVNGLRPDNPFLPAILKLPVRNGVTIHSIIAQTDPAVPIEQGTDGVVPYTSAHLDSAVSEKIILDANHRSVLRNDECVEEVWRILKLHDRANHGN